MTDSITNLRVTNMNDFVITDRFDGVPFVFEPKKPVKLPADAALHIFGWTPDCPPETCKTHTCRRFGWNTPAHMEKGTDNRFFGKLKFEKVLHRIVEVVEEETAPVALIPTKGGPKMSASDSA
jgi:hypothetical protein